MKKINGHGPLRHGAAEEFLPGNAGNDGSAKPATQIRHGKQDRNSYKQERNEPSSDHSIGGLLETHK